MALGAYSMKSDSRLNEYGAVLAEYEGRGTLRQGDSADTQCTFRAFQLRDGYVVVLCEAPDAGLSWLLSSARAMGLTGTTVDGWPVTAKGLCETNYLPDLTNRESGVYSAYRADSLDVAFRSSEVSRMSRFAITNLTLANPELRVSHPSIKEARIRRADGYPERVKRLYTVKGIDVTAYLEVHADNTSVRESAADDICYLLSVARATKVQWIAREDYSEDGAPVQFHYAPRVTKVYCALPTIDPRHPRDTEGFLEVALPRYLANRDKWQAPGLVDTYLDAKAEADYLEVRGIKLAVAMEVLKEAFVSATQQPYLACSDAEFRAVRPKLKTAIGGVLCQHGWQGPQRAIVYGNLGALNRVSFRDHVAALCAYLDLALPESDLKLFVRCRDSLVHRGRFYSESATEEDRESLAPHSTSVEEYFWLLHVLDRLLLRIVGYRGPYIDWSDVCGPRRVDAF